MAPLVCSLSPYTLLIGGGTETEFPNILAEPELFAEIGGWVVLGLKKLGFTGLSCAAEDPKLKALEVGACVVD